MPDPLILNESQRRHYAVLLAMLEQSLWDVERLAGGEPPGVRLTPVHSDLPVGAAAILRRECAELRLKVYALADRLGVSSQPASAARRVHAELISSVIHLEDSGSGKLAAYGPVDPSVGRLLDPSITELHDRLNALASRIGPPAEA